MAPTRELRKKSKKCPGIVKDRRQLHTQFTVSEKKMDQIGQSPKHIVLTTTDWSDCSICTQGCKLDEARRDRCYIKLGRFSGHKI